ncbi:hypothetical protein IDH44_06750 [Paenibacillus sp. IB182496]|uniref:Uncharacterized protein n=2 Tax=Paenibacillus sabuli TaxID=2772509 RepID=A0A927BQI7_9BACL|nr:hypothetical protein [Paenibacillus sabuli]
MVAEDCSAIAAEIPAAKGDKVTAAVRQYQLIAEHPYRYTSDDVLFQVHAERHEFPAQEWGAAREQYFAKGQACFRASPLGKRYGWGIHADEEGRLALYGVETMDYDRLASDPELKVLRAMRSKRKAASSD